MAVDERASRVAVAWNWIGSGNVSIVDAASGAVTSTSAANGGTTALAVDEPGGRIFSAHNNDVDKDQYFPTDNGTLDVLDGSTGAVLSSRDIGYWPFAIAVDDEDQKVYVANRGFTPSDGRGTLSILDEHPGQVAAPRRPVPTAPAPPDCCGARFFARTAHNLSGSFLTFWQDHGGLDTFGYPRTDPFVESARWVQYTERLLLEQVDGRVQVAPLGRLLTAGRFFPRVAPFAPRPDRLYFAATGHSLSARFLTYWQSHDGATLLGAPISEVITEGNGDGSGRRYPLQWFENGRLEYHPELAGTRYAMELGLVGMQALRQRGWLSDDSHG
jgi:hypothetical protein